MGLKPAKELKNSDACLLRGICLKFLNRWFRRKEQIHFRTKNLFILRSLKAWLKLTKFAKHIYWKYVFWDIFWKGDWAFNFKIELVLGWFAPRYAMMLRSRTISSWNRLPFWSEHEVMNVTFYHSSCQRSALLWWTLLSLPPIRCCHCWSSEHETEGSCYSLPIFSAPSPPRF